jgi:uncharacterized protein
MARVIHFEVHADDPERAISFYSRVFGWKFEQWNESVDYWSVTTGPDDQPGINGGLVRRRGGIDGQAVTAFVCTIQVDDLDATVASAMGGGATVALEKMAIPGVGWLAYLKDTESNIFGLMQEDSTAQLPADYGATGS